ncbi:hypothetical protein [Natronolimnobius sp. AArcel1]|uniref:hypothetical protein n=1 Tax=Natronolimnobius sp. AArcel1 TaxID=1679093 RepID=UPI0031B70C3D
MSARERDWLPVVLLELVAAPAVVFERVVLLAPAVAVLAPALADRSVLSERERERDREELESARELELEPEPELEADFDCELELERDRDDRVRDPVAVDPEALLEDGPVLVFVPVPDFELVLEDAVDPLEVLDVRVLVVLESLSVFQTSGEGMPLVRFAT